MLPLPNLPTDSLYKFISLSGVTLFFLGGGLLYLDDQRQTSQTAEIRAIGARSHHATELIKADLNSRAGLRSPDLERHQRAADSLMGEMDARVEAFLEENQGNSVTLILLAAMAVGLYLAGHGFVLWYKRVQKYQDMILRNEASNLR